MASNMPIKQTLDYITVASTTSIVKSGILLQIAIALSSKRSWRALAGTDASTAVISFSWGKADWTSTSSHVPSVAPSKQRKPPLPPQQSQRAISLRMPDSSAYAPLPKSRSWNHSCMMLLSIAQPSSKPS